MCFFDNDESKKKSRSKAKSKFKSKSGSSRAPRPAHWTGDGLLDTAAFATAVPTDRRAIAAKKPTIDTRGHFFAEYVHTHAEMRAYRREQEGGRKVKKSSSKSTSKSGHSSSSRSHVASPRRSEMGSTSPKQFMIEDR